MLQKLFKNKQEDLSWEFEWIWIYISKENTWEFKISFPISWSQFDKVWINKWDIINKISWIEITKSMKLKEIIDFIKLQIWKQITLEIKRWEKILNFDINIEKIKINNEEKNLNKFQYNFNEKWVEFLFDLVDKYDKNNLNKLDKDINKLNNFFNTLDEDEKQTSIKYIKENKSLYLNQKETIWFSDKVISFLKLFYDILKKVLNTIGISQNNYSLKEKSIDINDPIVKKYNDRINKDLMNWEFLIIK